MRKLFISICLLLVSTLGFSQADKMIFGELTVTDTIETQTGYKFPDGSFQTTAGTGGTTSENSDSLGGEPPSFYLDRINHIGLDSTNDIVGFQDSVTSNTDVSANTVHRGSDGTDHAFIDQDITSGSSPSFDGKNVKGVEGFFLQPRGLFGSGPGFADEGFIGDLPVVLFASNSTEKAIYTFFSLGRMVLTDTNPTINFIIYSTTAPVATTSDSVRWQLETRYIGESELATKAPDETFLITGGLPTTTANTRQSIIKFTLDRTLIATEDVLLFTLSRIGGDGSDIYGSDVGVGQSGIRAEANNNNP